MEGNTMHAMMSDRAGRPSRSEYLPCEPQSGESVALAEARRVLAVAEPTWPVACVLFTGRRDGRREFVAADWLQDRDWTDVAHGGRDALAEALSAFVGADDPAAYLARKAQASKVRESILRVAAGFESHA